MYGEWSEDGVSEVHGRKMMFVRFVHIVLFQNAIVYVERRGRTNSLIS